MMQAPDALPLHLMLAMMQSGSFPTGLAGWSASSPSFKPWWLKSPLEMQSDAVASAWQQLSDQASEAQKSWLNALLPAPSNGKKAKPSHAAAESPKDLLGFAPYFFDPSFLGALGEQAFKNSAGFVQGLQSYLGSEYERPEKKYKTIWKMGSAQLLDLAPDRTDAVAVFCVPSLINKSYVLDLYPEASFVEHLKSQDFRPLILDWGVPGDSEKDFACGDYITAYALAALQHLRENHDGPIALLGYCMGGIFTVAMAQLAQLFTDALILLATPWDFSAPDTPNVLLEPSTQLMLRNWIRLQDPVAPVVTQTVFHLINPWRVQQKYSEFPNLAGKDKQHFLAVEQWVNDGVALSKRVAEECFVDWPHCNILATHQWKVGRRWIEPASITCPTLAIVPTRDAIVPQGCALPLTKELKRCDVIMPDTGHVSMVVGKKAREALWQPTAQWLKDKF